MRALIDEFNAIPWNARGRKVGHTIAALGMLLVLTAPMWVEAVVFKAVGR